MGSCQLAMTKFERRLRYVEFDVNSTAIDRKRDGNREDCVVLVEQ